MSDTGRSAPMAKTMENKISNGYEEPEWIKIIIKIIEDKIAVEINSIEFWSNGKYRLHNRIIYTKLADKQEWQLKKLYP